MGGQNKDTRIGLRWTHLPIRWLIDALAYISAREGDAYLLFMQAVFIPLLVIIGGRVW